jgi:hypothetical protein
VVWLEIINYEAGGHEKKKKLESVKSYRMVDANR